ncbi:MAG: glycosyltransferase [Cyclobacteriaceae bacterium]
MSRPLVAVWMITYNHEGYISKALDSVLFQSTDFEFMVYLGEDCSLDNTRAICIDYAEKYPRHIRLYLNKSNDHIANGLGIYNACLSSGAKYIAMLEGDDFWTDSTKLRKQVEFLEANPDFSLSFTDCRIINSNGDTTKASKISADLKRDIYQTELVQGLSIPTLGVMFRVLPELGQVLMEIARVKNGDTFLFAILGQFGKAHYHHDIEPAVYRQHSGGVWSGTDRLYRFESAIHTFGVLQEVIQPKYKRIVIKALVRKWGHLASTAFKTAKYIVFLRAYVHTLLLSIRYLYFRPAVSMHLRLLKRLE